MSRHTRASLLVASVLGLASSVAAQPAQQPTGGGAPRPIRALYVTGGGFHDFDTQKTIVPPGLAERVRLEWTVDHTAGKATNVLIARHENTDWTKQFDVVVYNMSFSHVVDVSWIERITAAHRESGVPAVIPVYLDLVARGLLWTLGHLQDDGQAAPGYAAR